MSHILLNMTKAKLKIQHLNYFLGTLIEIIGQLLKTNV